jgi:hypothetical protein
MPGPHRLVALLALALAGGCIEFEHAPTSAGEPGPGSTTGDDEPAPPMVQCDPLAQNCPDGQACALFYPDFMCIEVATPGLVGDPCGSAFECGPGLACSSGVYLASCDASSCCTSLCDLGDAGADCIGAELCVPLYGEGAPSTYADYGVCRLAE